MIRRIFIILLVLASTVMLSAQTAPVTNIYFSFQDDLQTKFIEFLDTAAFTIEMAFYDIELEDVGNKLIEKHNLGIAVRVVTDDNQAGSSSQIDELRAAGITVIEGETNALMHNKFCVIDERYIWIGSWNATYNGTYLNNNNAMIMDDLTIAENYITEFSEMFDDSDFSNASPVNTPNPIRVINGMSIETYFAPEDDVMDHIIPHVNDAQSSIYFMAFSFSHDDLANSIINRYKAGVTVKGILEQSQLLRENATSLDEMSRAGIDVHRDRNPFNMHHKVIMIDGKVLFFGSF
ncbi:hypothetical protein KAJ27_17375, partial [bacterium]|nr:hypothetical protein [bacterium]